MAVVPRRVPLIVCGRTNFQTAPRRPFAGSSLSTPPPIISSSIAKRSLGGRFGGPCWRIARRPVAGATSASPRRWPRNLRLPPAPIPTWGLGWGPWWSRPAEALHFGARRPNTRAGAAVKTDAPMVTTLAAIVLAAKWVVGCEPASGSGWPGNLRYLIGAGAIPLTQQPIRPVR